MGKNIRVKTIKCGDCHCLLLGFNGKCYSWGDNSHWQCGFDRSVCKTVIDPTLVHLRAEYKIEEIKVGSFHNYLRSEKGDHILFGLNEYNICSLITPRKGHWTIYRINDVFDDLTNGKRRIWEVYVGNRCTWIMSENKH